MPKLKLNEWVEICLTKGEVAEGMWSQHSTKASQNHGIVERKGAKQCNCYQSVPWECEVTSWRDYTTEANWLRSRGTCNAAGRAITSRDLWWDLHFGSYVSEPAQGSKQKANLGWGGQMWELFKRSETHRISKLTRGAGCVGEDQKEATNAYWVSSMDADSGSTKRWKILAETDWERLREKMGNVFSNVYRLVENF